MESLYTFSYKENQKLDYNVILNSDPNVSQHNSDTICFKFYGCVATRYQDVSRLLPITYVKSWLKLDLIGDNFCPRVTINVTIAISTGEKGSRRTAKEESLIKS